MGEGARLTSGTRQVGCTSGGGGREGLMGRGTGQGDGGKPDTGSGSST